MEPAWWTVLGSGHALMSSGSWLKVYRAGHFSVSLAHDIVATAPYGAVSQTQSKRPLVSQGRHVRVSRSTFQRVPEIHVMVLRCI